MLATTVRCEDAQVLRAEVDESAGKRSHRNRSSSPARVRLLQPLLPRPQKRRWPATYSRSQTPQLRPDEKAIQDDHFETDALANMPRGLVHVAGSERRILSHPDSPHHRRFLRFAFEGVAYQYKVLPFGLSLATRTFTRCMDVALSPLRQKGIRILNSLDDWLILAQLQAVLTIAPDPPPQPLRLPGAQGQLCQEHTVTQPASFVPGHSYRLCADDSNCLSEASHVNSASRFFLQGRDRPSAQSFPENSGPYDSGFAGTSVGSASHATYPVLAEAGGSIRGLASRTPPRNGDSGLCISPGPLERPLLAKARRDLRHGAQKEGCHDRRFQQRLGSAV